MSKQTQEKLDAPAVLTEASPVTKNAEKTVEEPLGAAHPIRPEVDELTPGTGRGPTIRQMSLDEIGTAPLKGRQTPRTRPNEDSSLTDWELIDGVYRHRPEAIRDGMGGPTGQDHEGEEPQCEAQDQGMQSRGEGSQMEDTQTKPGSSQTLSTTEIHTGLNPETCPVGALLCNDGEIQPLEVVIRSRTNNMSEQEKLAMTRLESMFGYSHRASYCKATARYVYRCGVPGCGVLINPNPLEKSVRCHFNQHHGRIRQPINITIYKSNNKVSQFCIVKPIASRLGGRGVQPGGRLITDYFQAWGRQQPKKPETGLGQNTSPMEEQPQGIPVADDEREIELEDASLRDEEDIQEDDGHGATQTPAEHRPQPEQDRDTDEEEQEQDPWGPGNQCPANYSLSLPLTL